MTDILEIFTARRSIYDLGAEIPLTNAALEKLIKTSLKQAPSAFNSQSARVVLLLDKEHHYLWEEIVLPKLKEVTPLDKFAATQNKIASFAAAKGTVLFFEDRAVVAALQESFPLYKEAFPTYSCQSSGMLQYMVWTAFADKHIGASLQHYNPLIDAGVKARWKLPESWRLMSQMPFGNIKTPAGSKEFLPLEARFKLFT